MRGDAFGAARALVLPTFALLGIALVAPGRLELAVRIYALVLCAAVIVVLLAGASARLSRRDARCANRRHEPRDELPPAEPRPRRARDRSRGRRRVRSALPPRATPARPRSRAAELAPQRLARGCTGHGARDPRRRRLGARPRRPATARRPARARESRRATSRGSSTRSRASDGARAGSGAVRARCSTRSRGPSSASARRLELVWLGFLADGHVLLEDFPGLAKTLAARSFAQVSEHALHAHPVHARSHALGRDGLVDLEPARRRLRVPPRADLHQPPPLGRDQPRAAEDAGGAARGDAGASGDDRRRHARPRAALPRDRDAEPDRVRGHVSAPRGAARSLPPAHGVRLPEPRGRGRRARPSHRARVGRRRAPAGRRSRDAPRHAGAIERVHVAPSVQEYCVDLVVGDARVAEHRGRREPARKPRAPEARALPSRARRPRLRPARRRQGDRGARRSHTGSSFDPELWVQRVSSEDVVREVLETVPTPRAEDVAAAPHA